MIGTSVEITGITILTLSQKAHPSHFLGSFWALKKDFHLKLGESRGRIPFYQQLESCCRRCACCKTFRLGMQLWLLPKFVHHGLESSWVSQERCNPSRWIKMDQDVTSEYHPSGPNGSQDARIKPRNRPEGWDMRQATYARLQKHEGSCWSLKLYTKFLSAEIRRFAALLLFKSHVFTASSPMCYMFKHVLQWLAVLCPHLNGKARSSQCLRKPAQLAQPS